MSSEEQTLEAIVAAINAQILDAVNNPKPSYKLGDRSVSWNQWLAELRKQKAAAKEEIKDIPFQETNVYTEGEIDADC